MSDDFGTVSARRARELEILRRQYREHRDALTRMAAEAPTEHLASEYGRLIRDIDGSLTKLDELDGRVASPMSGAGQTPSPVVAAPAVPPRIAPAKAPGDPLRDETEPGTAPFAEKSFERAGAAYEAHETPSKKSGAGLLAGFAVILVAAIAALIWYGSRDRRESRQTAVPPVVTETAVADTAVPAAAPAPAVPAVATAATAAITVAPPAADFGVVRKGTHAVRQVQIANNTAQILQYQVSRSACRCLFYEYRGKLSPKQKETLTITLDATRVKGSSVEETITVAAKGSPSAAASLQVSGAVQ